MKQKVNMCGVGISKTKNWKHMSAEEVEMCGPVALDNVVFDTSHRYHVD